MYRRSILVGLFLVLTLVFLNTGTLVHSENGESIKIIFREAGGQYYTTSLYSTLISDLEKVGATVSKYNASEALLPLDNLTQFDILVIPNPGTEFNSTEMELIKNYLEGGGNILIMGDIQYDDRHYGKPDYLNALLEYLRLADKVMFWGTNDNGDEIKDDVSKIGGRNWQIDVSSQYFNPHIISVGIEKVAVNSPSLIVSDPSIIVATSPETSYAEDTQGNVHARGKIPWLVAIETGGGKVVVCGGSRIFSDATLYGAGMSFINYGDNERLFFNIVWWLTGQKLKAPTRVMVYIQLLDIIGIIAGIIAAHVYRLKSRSIVIFSVIGGIIFALIGMLQVLILGETVIGILGSDWGYVATGIPGEIAVEAWGVAGMRYFLAGIIVILLGAFIYWLILKIDDYLHLGIREKLGRE